MPRNVSRVGRGCLPLQTPPHPASPPQNPMSLTTFIVTLFKPEDISWEDLKAMMGEEGYPTCGKAGLLDCLMQALGEGRSGA